MRVSVNRCLVYCISLLWIVSASSANKQEAECRHNYSNTSPSRSIFVDSQNFSSKGYVECEYRITAPKQHYIELNFSRIEGFEALSAPESSQNMCLPKLSINEGMDGTKNQTTINDGVETPHVFQSYSSSIRILYVLNSCSRPQHSGFTLSWNFLRSKDRNCEFECDSSKCLPSSRLCDGTEDCVDKSDEAIGKCPTPRSDHVPYIVIVILVSLLIVLLGVIFCVVRNSKCMSRQRHVSRESQLRPPSQNSEILVSPPSQDPYDQQVSLLRERSVLINSMKHCEELGYPPHVPRSKDGEEGYTESQKDILSHRGDECFRPPPNRTVHDRESPPPYSESPNRSFDCFASKMPPSGQDSNGYPNVIRSHSVSGSANGERHPHFYCSNSHSQTCSTSSHGHSGGGLTPGRLSGTPRGSGAGGGGFGSSSAPTAPTIMSSGDHGHCNSAPGGQGRRSGSVPSARFCNDSPPPDYHKAFTVNSANGYRSPSDSANV